jgi:hypothetical protein
MLSSAPEGSDIPGFFLDVKKSDHRRVILTLLAA